MDPEVHLIVTPDGIQVQVITPWDGHRERRQVHSRLLRVVGVRLEDVPFEEFSQQLQRLVVEPPVEFAGRVQRILDGGSVEQSQ